MMIPLKLCLPHSWQDTIYLPGGNKTSLLEKKFYLRNVGHKKEVKLGLLYNRR